MDNNSKDGLNGDLKENDQRNIIQYYERHLSYERFRSSSRPRGHYHYGFYRQSNASYRNKPYQSRPSKSSQDRYQSIQSKFYKKPFSGTGSRTVKTIPSQSPDRSEEESMTEPRSTVQSSTLKLKVTPVEIQGNSGNHSLNKQFKVSLLNRAKSMKYDKLYCVIHDRSGRFQHILYNTSGKMNNGSKICCCNHERKKSGICHSIFAGETAIIPRCDPYSNNINKLFHYVITVTPNSYYETNFPTTICCNGEKYVFQGFSLFSHIPLNEFPKCKIVRFNTEYEISFIEEESPLYYEIQQLDYFYKYLFIETLGMVDFKPIGDSTGCSIFHFMPRFIKECSDNQYEILAMEEVFKYLIKQNKPVVNEEQLYTFSKLSKSDWEKLFVEELRGMIVRNPGSKPSSIRVDKITYTSNLLKYPYITHYKLQNNTMKRNVPIFLNTQGFFRTGIRADIIQHALIIPPLINHLRTHQSFYLLENTIKYKFKNRNLLQLALEWEHSIYREYLGLNPDHARNCFSNCGLNEPFSGNEMERAVGNREGPSTTRYGEARVLKYFGEAVLEFVISHHIFYLNPKTFNSILMDELLKNETLLQIAKKINLVDFMYILLCKNTYEAISSKIIDCCKALLGAVFLDGGIRAADKTISALLFKGDENKLKAWFELDPEAPNFDRSFITDYRSLESVHKFQKQNKTYFKNIKILARALTDSSTDFILTNGDNRSLAVFGKSIINFIVTEVLYMDHFNFNEEQFLSQRSTYTCLSTKATICRDLDILNFTSYGYTKKYKIKNNYELAHLFDAYIGAVFVDRGIEYCKGICKDMILPRLAEFEMIKRDENNPIVSLRKYCLSLSVSNYSLDIPIYINIPRTDNMFEVELYFKGIRLASGIGNNEEKAKLMAAKLALEYYHLSGCTIHGT